MCNPQAKELSDGDFIFEDKEDDEVWEHERRLRAKETATQTAGALPVLLLHRIVLLLQDLHKPTLWPVACSCSNSARGPRSVGPRSARPGLCLHSPKR